MPALRRDRKPVANNGGGLSRLLPFSTKSTKQRLQLLWNAAKYARDLDTAAVVGGAFMQLAAETKLFDKNGHFGSDIREDRRRHGKADVRHVLVWALRGWNPFETGPLT